jgi:hypothetical protein
VTKVILSLLCITILSLSSAYAEDIAKCGEVNGIAYYLDVGVIPEKNSGWHKDGINGQTQLIRNENGEYDILYVDATKNIISARADGAKVSLVNKSDRDISFVSSYPRGTTEIYSFFQESGGRNKYSHFSLKPNGAPSIPKRSLFIGECDIINFDMVTE